MPKAKPKTTSKPPRANSAIPNKCHAVTFLFYRINKIQKIKFELVAIERRVLDPVAPMPVPANPFRPTGQVATVPQDVPATNTKRLAVQETAIQADQNFRQLIPEQTSLPAALPASMPPRTLTAAQVLGPRCPIADELRAKALAEVDAQLVRQGLIERASGRRLHPHPGRDQLRARDIHPHRGRDRQELPG